MVEGYRTNALRRRGPSLAEAPRAPWWHWLRRWRWLQPLGRIPAYFGWRQYLGGRDRRDAAREERLLLQQVREISPNCWGSGVQPIELVRAGWTVAELNRVARAAGVSAKTLVDCLATWQHIDKRPRSAAVALVVEGIRIRAIAERKWSRENEERLAPLGGPVTRPKPMPPGPKGYSE